GGSEYHDRLIRHVIRKRVTASREQPATPRPAGRRPPHRSGHHPPHAPARAVQRQSCAQPDGIPQQPLQSPEQPQKAISVGDPLVHSTAARPVHRPPVMHSWSRSEPDRTVKSAWLGCSTPKSSIYSAAESGLIVPYSSPVKPAGMIAWTSMIEWVPHVPMNSQYCSCVRSSTEPGSGRSSNASSTRCGWT